MAMMTPDGMYHHGTMAIISWKKGVPTRAMIIHPSKTGTPPRSVMWLGLKIIHAHSMANTGHSELCGSITLPNLDTSTLQQKKILAG